MLTMEFEQVAVIIEGMTLERTVRDSHHDYGPFQRQSSPRSPGSGTSGQPPADSG